MSTTHDQHSCFQAHPAWQAKKAHCCLAYRGDLEQLESTSKNSSGLYVSETRNLSNLSQLQHYYSENKELNGYRIHLTNLDPMHLWPWQMFWRYAGRKTT